MRPEVEHHLLLAPAEDPRIGESGQTGANLDGAAAGVVKDAPVEGPAVDVPHPVCQRAVDERQPEEAEDHGGEHAAALRHGADHEGAGHRGEHHLVEGVEELRNKRRARGRRAQRVHEAELLEVADEAARARGAEGQRVAPEVPLEDGDAEGHEASPHKRESGLSPRQARVQERDTRHHEEHHACGDEDEGLVAGLVPLVQVLRGCEERPWLASCPTGVCLCRRMSAYSWHRGTADSVVLPPRALPVPKRTHSRHSDELAVEERGMESLLESPPVSVFVPLNSTGAPMCEYDILLGGSRSWTLT